MGQSHGGTRSDRWNRRVFGTDSGATRLYSLEPSRRRGLQLIADLVIRSGTIVTADGIHRAAVAVLDGKIAAIDRDDAMPEAREVIMAMGKHILPGLIDTHVHLREPGHIEREDWLTGTQAAAAGGITTVLEMPLAVPPVHSVETLQERAKLVEPKSVVDFGLYSGANIDNLDQIESLAEAGAVAFKTFRTRAPRGRERELVGICSPDAGQTLLVMERIARTGRLHVIHAEDQQILDITVDRVQRSGRRDGRAHAISRPEVVEAASVAQCIELARATGARVQLAHTSSPAALSMIAQAKLEGLQVTAETCPHYLFFTEETLDRWGPYAKCNPPLRSKEAQDALWEAVRTGVVDVIGTDHAPFSVEEKAPFVNDIWGAFAGIPGLEQFLPLLLTAVAEGRLTLLQLVKLTSENAARLFGLWPRKGNVAVDADADLTIVDTTVERTCDHRILYTKARNVALIYDGLWLRGWPVTTIVRGQVVMRDGKVIGEPGWGRWVTPQ